MEGWAILNAMDEASKERGGLAAASRRPDVETRAWREGVRGGGGAAGWRACGLAGLRAAGVDGQRQASAGVRRTFWARTCSRGRVEQGGGAGQRSAGPLQPERPRDARIRQCSAVDHDAASL